MCMNEPKSRLSRRTLFAGAGTAGALAAAAALVRTPPCSEPAVSETPPPPERGGGYQLTEHVQRYYRSTRT
jgi:hypothetical protein